MPQNWGTSKSFDKHEKKPKIVNLNTPQIRAVQRCFRGNQRCSPLNQRCFRENQRWNSTVRRWFLALKFFNFSAVQSWIIIFQTYEGNKLRWNRPDIFFESELISAECLWDLNPGYIGRKLIKKILERRYFTRRDFSWNWKKNIESKTDSCHFSSTQSWQNWVLESKVMLRLAYRWKPMNFVIFVFVTSVVRVGSWLVGVSLSVVPHWLKVMSSSIISSVNALHRLLVFGFDSFVEWLSPSVRMSASRLAFVWQHGNLPSPLMVVSSLMVVCSCGRLLSVEFIDAHMFCRWGEDVAC